MGGSMLALVLMGGLAATASAQGLDGPLTRSPANAILVNGPRAYDIQTPISQMQAMAKRDVRQNRAA